MPNGASSGSLCGLQRLPLHISPMWDKIRKCIFFSLLVLFWIYFTNAGAVITVNIEKSITSETKLLIISW